MMESQNTIAETRVGTLLGGKYELQRVVGTGGMGAVYEAFNTWTGRRVAIKVLHPAFAARPEVLARFFQEAQATTRIAHPNIVDVLDLGQDASDGAFYIVQEFLEGTDLRALMDEAGPMSPRRVIELMTPVMAALAAAHAHGIVHRDIKPENIVVTRGPDGGVVPKLIDFGVSKLIGQAGDPLCRTLPGTTLGTPCYMSPEQCRGDAGIDGRSDVWGVGAVLYEMLAGELAFDAPTYNGLLVQIVTGTPARLETHAPGVPTALANLVHGALTTAPDARIPSMEAFVEALRQCPVDGSARPPPLRVAVRSEEATKVATPMHWVDAPAPVALPLPRRRTALVPAAAGLGVAGALLLLLASWSSAVHSAPTPVARAASAPVSVTLPLPLPVIAAPASPAPPLAPPARVGAVRRPVRRARAVTPVVAPAVARSANGALILSP